MPGGQPTKYRDVYCQMIIEHLSQGLSVESFAGVVGVCFDTIYEWAKVHPEFSDAIKQGKAKKRLWWEKLGQAGIAGKLKNFNASGWIFHMKCREQYKEDNDSDNRVPIKIELVKRGT